MCHWTHQSKKSLLLVVSELLLDPALTSTVARVFRPVLVDLIIKLIEPNEEQHGAHSIPTPFSLDRHDSIGACLSVLLMSAPQLQSQVLSYYEYNPPPFERISRSHSPSQTTQSESYEDMAATCYRLLRFCPALRTRWNWGPLYILLTNENPTTRVYVAKSIALLLKLDNQQTTRLFEVYLDPSADLQLTLDQTQNDTRAIESYLLSLKDTSTAASTDSAELPTTDSTPTTAAKSSDESDVLGASDLSGTLVDVCGVLLPRTREVLQPITSGAPLDGARASENSAATAYVMTDTTSGNLRALALALSQGLPILLEGVAGAGKSSLVNELARCTGKDTTKGVLKVHLGDQTDSKTLLGTYVCTDIPGEFRWQPGVLTQAMRSGKWLIVEDIDLAPIDVLSVLVPVLEKREVFIPGRGEVVRAARGFQLFATQTLSESGTARKGGGRGSTMLANLWTRVVVQALTLTEMRRVIDTIYPALAPFSSLMLEVYQTLANIGRRTKDPEEVKEATTEIDGESDTHDSDGDTAMNDSLDSQQQREQDAGGYAPSEMAAISRIRRAYTYRDLLKWCTRCCQYAAYHTTITSVSQNLLTPHLFYEAADVLAGMFPMVVRRRLLHLIGHKLGISTESVEHRGTTYCPEVSWSDDTVVVGRITLPKGASGSGMRKESSDSGSYALTRLHARLIESVAACVSKGESVLLVGETGTGKTTLVQRLALSMNQKLVVVNMSQQSDLSDLVGGFRPVDVRVLATPLVDTFDRVFKATFSQKANAKFLNEVRSAYARGKWKRFLALLNAAGKMYTKKFGPSAAGDQSESRANGNAAAPVQKAARSDTQGLQLEWEGLMEDVQKFTAQMKHVDHGFAFSFVEGTLVKAMRSGHWILLDEMNLAAAETLECLNGLLESPTGSLVLTERGDQTPIPRHPQFRLFGCMNPATDVGKRNLPPGVRSRFTELYVDELTHRADLVILANQYLSRLGNLPTTVVDAVVSLYLDAIRYAESELTDGANQKPHYSLRTLCRALDGSRLLVHRYGLQRALYEGFCSAFLTSLGRESYLKMQSLVHKYVGFGMSPKQVNRILPNPALLDASGNVSETALASASGGDDRSPIDEGLGWCRVEHIWLKCGDTAPIVAQEDTKFVLTESTRENLRRIARALVSGQFPVLLQGPTSCGKTSMVEYMAQRSGHRFVRINNHEHTDLQEYLGAYTADDKGRLVFQEGVLVQAVRHGYWVVLDELNLAPTDVLEALNRLLDDNRELMIPETQEVIKPHPHFRLFATQNPPGVYGGRKVLSRAFRNRFVELHFDDIPENELETILAKRTQIAPSYCTKLVAILKDLQKRRQGTRLFAGKHGFITLRDLFRWAGRDANGYDQLAEDGYMVLAEKCRRDEEKQIVKETIEKHLKVSLDPTAMYGASHEGFAAMQTMIKQASADPNNSLYPFRNIVATQSMLRLITLVQRCLQFKEPVLLVGETGCGKTTVFQLLTAIQGQLLRTVNCHQHTETADFIGGLRPVRGRDGRIAAVRIDAHSYVSDVLSDESLGCTVKLPEESEWAASTNEALRAIVSTVVQSIVDGKYSSTADLRTPLVARGRELLAEFNAATTLFAWHDGPLVQAMQCGDMFMIDEISLADDSVLERLNSVLEPYRGLTLAEKGSDHVQEIVGVEDFRIVATMNPGGDFGKKELSPALRNRFTEIWVPSVSDPADLKAILDASMSSYEGLSAFSEPILSFVNWFRVNHNPKVVVSLRNILGWSNFMVNCVHNRNSTGGDAFVHGGCMAFVDALGTGSSVAYGSHTRDTKKACVAHLTKLAAIAGGAEATSDAPVSERRIGAPVVRESATVGSEGQFEFCVDSFAIPIGPLYSVERSSLTTSFALSAPTTLSNMQRVLRGLQLTMPILLEGSPGVGKTSLVTAVAKAAGYPLVRINLSDQTDIMDLFGSDLPVEGGQGGEFAWRDGPFLEAMKNGKWILLDELNLASQSVLEGLNACLDHRGVVYIPELDRSFECKAPLRVFACQNPLAQGGGRKGLPKSFLNRFTRVYVEELDATDLRTIAKSMFPHIDQDIIDSMISFNSRLHHATMVDRAFGSKGGPWEFNLRDVLRWCEVMSNNQSQGRYSPNDFLDFLYLQRMRTESDRTAVLDLYHQCFAHDKLAFQHRIDEYPSIRLTESHVQVGSTLAKRHHASTADLSVGARELLATHALRRPLKHVLTASEMRWMSIIVGDSAAGKTSLIRLAASLTGNRLHEFAMNSAVDTSELLGGYEQLDMLRRRTEIVTRASALVAMVSQALVLVPGVASAQSGASAQQALSMVQQVHNTWQMYQLTDQHTPSPTAPDGEASDAVGFSAEQRDAMFAFLDQIEAAVRSCAETPATVGITTTCSKLRQAVDALATLDATHVRGSFEWVDGILVRALKEGHWLLIDNANLCSPSVMDRLNPLMEPNGTLVLTERGVNTHGALECIIPHHNFRLILSVDPKYGELSRAMRNRGVEISLVNADAPASSRNLASLPTTPTHPTDMVILLQTAGVANPVVTSLLVACHYAIRRSVPASADFPLSVRDVLHAGRLISEMLHRGFDIQRALRTALVEVYVRCRRVASVRATIQEVIESHLSSFSPTETHTLTDTDTTAARQPLPAAELWYQPALFSCDTLVRAPRMAIIARDGVYLTHLKNLYARERVSALLAASSVDAAGLEQFGTASSSAWSYLPADVCVAKAMCTAVVSRGCGIDATLKVVTDTEFLTTLKDQLMWAGAYFLERTCLDDVERRVTWVNEWTKTPESVVGREMHAVSKGLQRGLYLLASCSHLETLRKAREQLSACLALPTGLLDSQPIACKANIQLWTALHSSLGNTTTNDETQNQLNTAWNVQCRVGNVLSVLYCRRWRVLFQEDQLQARTRRTSHREYSILQQSFLIYQKTLPSSKALHPLCTRFFGFIVALDRWLSDILASGFVTAVDTSKAHSVSVVDSDITSLAHLLSARDALYAAANTSFSREKQTEIVSSLVVHWRWFLRALCQFREHSTVTVAGESSSTASDYADALNAACEYVSDCLQLRTAVNGLVLWKNWLRPRGYKTLREYDVMRKLLDLSSDLDVYKPTAVSAMFPAFPVWLLSLPGHPFLEKANRTTIQTLTEGIATMLSVEQAHAVGETQTNGAANAVARSGAANRQAMLEKIYQVLEQIALPVSASANTELLSGEKQQSGSELSTVELWPVYDHQLLMEEQRLVSQISALVVLLRTEAHTSQPKLSAQVRAVLLQRIEAHMSRNRMDSYSRPASDWAPWLCLRWLLSLGEDRLPWESVVPVLTNAIASFHRGVRSHLLAEVAYMPLAAKLVESAANVGEQFGTEDALDAMTQVLQQGEQKLAKTSRLPASSAATQLGLNTDVGYMTALVAQFSSCSIGDMPRRITQLQKVEHVVAHRAQALTATHLQTVLDNGEPVEGSVETKTRDLQHFLALESTLFGVLLGFRKGFSHEDYLRLCQLAHSAIASRVDCAEDTAPAHTAADVHPFSSEDSEALAAIVERCANASLRECAVWCIRPFLQLYAEQAEPQRVLAMGWVYMGLLQIHLGACASVVDPSTSYSLKERDGLLRQRAIEARMKVVSTTEATLDGGDGSGGVDMKECVAEMNHVHEKLKHTSMRVLVRPGDDTFSDLRAEVSRYLSSIGSARVVLDLCACIVALLREMRDGAAAQKDTHAASVSVSDVLSRWRMWRESQRSFCSSLRRFSGMFVDIVDPLMLAIDEMVASVDTLGDQLVHQMDMLYSAPSPVNATPITGDLQAYMCTQIRPRMTRLVTELLRFPSFQKGSGCAPFRYVHRTQDLTLAAGHVQANSPILSLITQFSGVPLAMSSLRHAYVHVLDTQTVGAAHVTDLGRMFSDVVDVWTAYEEQKLAKERADALAFKTKEKVFVLEDERTLEERLYQQQCPSFDDEFTDITKDYHTNASATASKAKPSEDSATLTNPLSPEATLHITDMHAAIFGTLGNHASMSHADKHTIEQEHLAAFRYNYEATLPLLEGLGLELSFDSDDRAQMDTLVAISLRAKMTRKHMLQTQHNNTLSVQSKEWSEAAPAADIEVLSALLNPGAQPILQPSPLRINHYTDTSLAEARRLGEIAVPMRVDATTHLVTWPEHPVLMGIVAVIDRILSFSIQASPLMKLLSAAELLLRQGMEWEAFAASHVSLKVHTEAVTRFILDMRKKELDQWSLALDSTHQEHEALSRRLWFHLYSVINADPTLESELGREDAIESHHKEIFTVVEEMVQTSTMGNFACRLRLIAQFHMQLKAELKSGIAGYSISAKVKLHDMLGSFYAYYRQYLPGIQAKLHGAKKPLERQLREHVKLAKWNDINYWAMKQAGDKTHRALHKFTTKWSTVLEMPLRTYLTEIEAATIEYPPAQPSAAMGSIITRVCHRDNWKPSTSVQAIGALSSPVLSRYEEWFHVSDPTRFHSRLAALTGRLTKVCDKQIMPALNPSTILGIEEFAVHIIQRVEQYRLWDAQDIKDTEATLARKKEQADAGADEEKPADKDSRALHKVMKRKDLAELFRQLSAAGLSYRSVAAEDESALLSHLFTEAHLEDDQLCPQTSDVADLAAKINDYFYKCVSRMVIIRKLYFGGRAQDLTPQDADRARGYSEHFLRLVVAQRRFLGDVSEELSNFKRFLKHTVHLGNRLVTTNGSGPVVATHALVLECWNETMDTVNTMARVVRETTAAISLHEESTRTESTIRNRLSSALAELHRVRTALHALKHEHIGVFESKRIDTAPPPMVVEVGIVTAGLDDVYARVGKVSEGLSGFLAGVVDSPNWPEQRSLLNSLRDVCAATHAAESRYRTSLRPHFSAELTPPVADMGAVPETVRERAYAFERDFDALIANVLIRVQRIVKLKEEHEQDTPESTAEWEDGFDPSKFTPNYLTRSHTYMTSVLKAAKLPAMNAAFASLSAQIAAMGDDVDAEYNADLLTACAGMLVRAVPVLERYGVILSQAMDEFVCLHKSVSKMYYILLNLFSDLLAKGFCTPPDLQDATADEQTGGEMAGMGEGQGENDVSEQIENEDQLTGTKDEEQNDEGGNVPEEDNAIEMEQEFDGDLYDMDKKELEDMEDDKDDGEEKEEQDMDDEMGDTNMDDADVVDERMWGDDEEDNEISEKEKKEDGKSMTNENEESEIVAKQDGDDEKPKDDKKKEEQENAEKPQPEPLPSQEEDQNNEDLVNEVQELEEDHHHHPQEQPNDDQAADDENPDVDLPEDMQLDDDAGDDKDEHDGPDGDGEETAPMEDEKAMAEEYDGAQELNDPEEGDDADPEGDVATDTEQKGNDEEEEEDGKQGEDSLQAAGESDQGDDEEEGDEGQPPKLMEDDNDVEIGAEQGIKEDHGEEGEGADEEEEEKHKPESSKMDTTSVGVNAEGGQRNSGETEEMETEDGPSSATDATSGQSKSGTDDKQASLERGNDGENDSGSKPQAMPEVNPFRSLGSTLQKWKEKLNVMDVEEEDPNAEDGANDGDNDEEMGGEGMRQFMKDEDEGQADDQVLGVATEEQLQQNQGMPDEPEGEKVEEETEMDVDETEGEKKPEDSEESGQKESSKSQAKSARNADKAEAKDSQADVEEEEIDSVDAEDATEEDKSDDKDANDGPDSSIYTQKNSTDASQDADDLALPTEDEIVEKREAVEKILEAWQDRAHDPNADAVGERLWQEYEAITSGLSQDLCEQLRVILEPTLATRLQGDYRTGKRLNLKRVIPYIASHFKKDKIWLRRTRPAKREYQVLLTIDDSESMSDSHSASLAYEAVTMISKALTTLEVGQLSVMSFGDQVKLLHPFHEQFGDGTGGSILQQLSFNQKNTNFEQLLETSYSHLISSVVSTDLPVSQLQLVISDGVCPDVESVRKWIRAYSDAGILLVFVVLDNPKAKFSILDYKTVTYPNGALTLTPYLETFPFPYYVVLRNINTLPDILADALRQWFELLRDDS
ncbi:hypothetical protein SARC_06594 [Sphaeroforma arctica JP610]|uniref:Midasin n=1 Tax=Sphaeroforma arctica JP610 TaxID=667725 RepID=A0A0L0FX09_9EUKA|nr:hypothetical protein SARC_06594 [Sphaeroforma arctica JP610]KNC81071.1 hypothetical protein SARC_06594 [Sphaeroforma arctica JP610]|eukprot:XP_014154973.1 hypothetical protein SARC_06594 [Sphaeroforma arctica JP610]